jgi:hypothetical protein
MGTKIPKNIGEGGSHVLTSKTKDILYAIYNDIKALKTAVETLNTKYNAHLGAASMHYNGTASVTDTTNTIVTTTVPTELEKE